MHAQAARVALAAAAAYRAGAVKLSDLQTTGTSPEWGTHVQRKSLKGALGEEGAQRWYVRVVKQAEQHAAFVERVRGLDVDWGTVTAEVRQVDTIGALEKHFRKHGEQLGVSSAAEYEQRLRAHVARDGLEYRVECKEQGAPMLFAVDRPTSEVLMYNVSSHQPHSYHWSKNADSLLSSWRLVKVFEKDGKWVIE